MNAVVARLARLALPGLLCVAAPAAELRPPPAWLEQAVFYQIYPQSYADSDGDGIGDLRGIIQKLPYLHDLGVTGIWLNPCFVSPFRDGGYDVADFYRVAPRYGTNDDLRELFAAARRLGIHVMLDLVAAHTSDQHPWFRESQRAERNAYTDWYIWTAGVGQLFAPNQQVVVGTAERSANYIASFYSCQPALNYGYARPDPAQPWQQRVDAPGPLAVRAELKKIMRFWFEMGASGFRVDMAGSLVKNDPDGTATAALWREFREWMDRDYPDKAMVSEWSEPQLAIPQGFHMDFLLQWTKPGYASVFREHGGQPAIFDRRGTTPFRKFLTEFEPLLAATRGRGFMALHTGNHDTTPRLGNGRAARDLVVAHAFLLTMPGVPFLYYGDELGMRSPPFSVNREGGYERTPARTPMQWDATPGAGFSTAPLEKFYLAVDPSPERPNVATQLADATSPLRAVQRFIALRRAHPALGASGDFRALLADAGQPIVYLRTREHDRVLVALNPTDRPLAGVLPADLDLSHATSLDGETHALTGAAGAWRVELPPLSYAIIQLTQ